MRTPEQAGAGSGALTKSAKGHLGPKGQGLRGWWQCLLCFRAVGGPMNNCSRVQVCSFRVLFCFFCSPHPAPSSFRFLLNECSGRFFLSFWFSVISASPE